MESGKEEKWKEVKERERERRKIRKRKSYLFLILLKIDFHVNVLNTENIQVKFMQKSPRPHQNVREENVLTCKQRNVIF